MYGCNVTDVAGGFLVSARHVKAVGYRVAGSAERRYRDGGSVAWTTAVNKI